MFSLSSIQRHFPSKAEAEVVQPLPGDSGGLLRAGVTLFYGNSKPLICSAATSVMLRHSCTCVLMQPGVLNELAF